MSAGIRLHDLVIVLVVTVVIVVDVVSVLTVLVSDSLTVSAAEALAWPQKSVYLRLAAQPWVG